MKKATVLLLITCMLLSAVGCTAISDTGLLSEPTETVFPIDSYDLQLTADSSFQEKTGGSFDLQITNGKAYVSVMAYKYIDLPEGVTPRDVYDMQNEDLFSKRTAVTVIEEIKTQTVSQKTVTQALHSAEKDGVKNYYATYLIDLPEEEVLAWVLVTATSSYLEAKQEYLNNIVFSLSATE